MRRGKVGNKRRRGGEEEGGEERKEERESLLGKTDSICTFSAFLVHLLSLFSSRVRSSLATTTPAPR